MSVELVNRIAVKADGVYINTHSNNDTAPFHSVKLMRISELYTANGGAEWRKKQALKDFVKLFSVYNNVRLVDQRNSEHESIAELRAALDTCYYPHRSPLEADELSTIVENSNNYTEEEKDKIIERLDETFDAIAIERAADYYLKNGGGKRFKIVEE
jgi:hypothetical protein